MCFCIVLLLSILLKKFFIFIVVLSFFLICLLIFFIKGLKSFGFCFISMLSVGILIFFFLVGNKILEFEILDFSLIIFMLKFWLSCFNLFKILFLIFLKIIKYSLLV